MNELVEILSGNLNIAVDKAEKLGGICVHEFAQQALVGFWGMFILWVLGLILLGIFVPFFFKFLDLTQKEDTPKNFTLCLISGFLSLVLLVGSMIIPMDSLIPLYRKTVAPHYYIIHDILESKK